MKWKQKKSVFYLDGTQKHTPAYLSCLLSQILGETREEYPEIVVICIGSDRVTGDSLGPLIGYKLTQKELSMMKIYGTLEYPVHALNLQSTLESIKSTHPDAFIIAIDASLGKEDHLGYITVGRGSLCPGAGVNKELPPVGDLFITGIVDSASRSDQLVLHTTRLSSVMKLADCISSGILLFHKIYTNKLPAQQQYQL